MRNFSLVSVVVAIIVSILGCGDGLDLSAGANLGYGGCDSYGQVCSGESYTDGAFETQIVPFADDTYGVTVTVTFEDAAAGEDVITTTELYPDAYGEYWFYSPYAPPEGRVEIEVQVYLQYDYSVDGVCNDAPQADVIAYNNGYEIDTDLRGSTPCYVSVDLRDVVD